MSRPDHLPDIKLQSHRDGALLFPWPMPGSMGALLSFSYLGEWKDFILSFSINPTLPDVITTKFRRAQKLYFLAWIDMDIIKAGELAAFAALELALRDRYLGEIKRDYLVRGKHLPKIGLDLLLKYMVEKDGLTNELIPMFIRCGGDPVARITGRSKPSLSALRNSLAHGDPFDGLPHAGLLELIRDLIEFAYRDYIAGTSDGASAGN